MAYFLSKWLKPRFFISGTNRPLAGGLLYTYLTGTTTNAATYTTSTGAENTNPIVLDDNGECDLFLDDTVSYRMILKDSDGVTQFDIDPVASNDQGAIATAQAAIATAAANAASTSESNAGVFATTATTQATNAATSASTATTQATNAATSASNAATSETNSATSETNAAASETAAQTAQTAAELARDVAVSNATAALASGKIYTTTAAGIAATTSGQCFLVTTSDTQLFNLYSNVATVATLLGQFSILSKTFFETIFDSTAYSRSGWIDAVVDGSTPPKLLHGIDDAYLWNVYINASFLGSALFANLSANGATFGGQALTYGEGYSQSGYQYAVIGGDGKNLLAVADDGTLESLPRPTYIDGTTYCVYDAADGSNVRQVYIENKSTGVITKISTGAGNNFSPRLTADNLGIIWTTDRDNPPIRNMLWSLISSISERPVFSNSDITCWGDSLTQGTGGGTNGDWPYQLRALQPTRTIYNQGIASQRSTDIAARQGGVAINITFPANTIQASGGATVTCDSNPLQYATSQKIAGTVSGIYGELTISGSTYTWTRKDAGSTVALSGATQFIVNNGLKNGGITVLWVGRNNVTSAPATVLSDIAAMVANLTALNKRYIVMSILNASTEGTGTSELTTILATNATLSSTYGNKYLDIRQTLVDSYNAGIPADVTAYGLNKVPPSLQSDTIHLNAAGYLLVAQTVSAKLTALGW